MRISFLYNYIFHKYAHTILTSAAKASAVVECVEETSKKQISVHLDMRNWLIIRDGDLKEIARIVGDDRGFFVAQRVWHLNDITFLDVYTYDTKGLRLTKKTLWLVERKNEGAEFDNMVDNYNYGCTQQ